MKSCRFLWAAAALALSAPLVAQVPGILSSGAKAPDMPTALARVERGLAMVNDRSLRALDDVATLRGMSTASDDAKAKADALFTQMVPLRAADDYGAIRPRLVQAAYLLLGKTWNGDAAYWASLSLDTTELIADSAEPLHVRLTQFYPAPAVEGLTIRTSIVKLAKLTRGADPVGPEAVVRTLWSGPLPARDLIASPSPFTVDLSGIADGDYAVQADILRGDTLVGMTRAPVRVVNGLAETARAVKAGSVGLGAKADTLATISYPFDTVQAVNGWRRDVPENLDFKAAMARSTALLAAVKAGGADPLWQTTGDQRRAYQFDAAHESMPYRLYVPKAWKPGMKMPLVVDVHGGGGNEDMDFAEKGPFAGLMQSLAEKHGMIVVAPLGYRPSGGYGSVYGKTTAGRIGVRPDVAADQNVPSLSEADTMNVVRRVMAEYGTDPRRTYLVGNSMGGGGTWYIGGKYASMFAAIAPCASSMPIETYDFTRLRNVPVMAVVGSLDSEVRLNVATKGVAAVKKLGGDATLVIVPDGVHGSAWLQRLPEIFDFFARHKRK